MRLADLRAAVETARRSARVEDIRRARILCGELTGRARSDRFRDLARATRDLQRELGRAAPPWTSADSMLDRVAHLIAAARADRDPQQSGSAEPPLEILVIDPSPTERERALRHSGPRTAHLRAIATIEDALAAATPADIILLDVAAVDPDILPRAVRMLREIGRTRPASVAVTSPVDDLPTRIAAARAGADLFLVKPLGRQALRDAVHHLTERAQAPRGRVLVLDDDPDFVDLARTMLDRAGYATIGLTDSEPLLESLRRSRPDAVLLDFGLPRYGGIELTAMLRGSREFGNTPVLFVSGRRDPRAIRAAFAAGADDYLIKPVSALDLTLRLDARIARSRQLRQAAERDPLTGLLVRGPFVAALENRLASALRDGSRLTFCLIDLDGFKAVNDEHGHLAGDEVLAAFGELLGQFRAEDLKCRWGGEEFAIAFPSDQSIGVVHALIERLLEQFRAMTFRDHRGEAFSVSFSAGIAQFAPAHPDMEELIQLTDRRLYRAKRLGRARVISADHS